MTYTNLTNEELVSIITETADNDAYAQLFRNLRPVILHEAAMYINTMETYTLEDLVQECHITCWEVISRGNWTPEKDRFSTYFGGAVRNKLIRLFRDYNLKNLICIGEQEDSYGNISRIYVESDYAKEYRRKKAEQQKRWYEKKRPPSLRRNRSRRKRRKPKRNAAGGSWSISVNTTPNILTSLPSVGKRTGLRRRRAGSAKRPKGWRRWHSHKDGNNCIAQEGTPEGAVPRIWERSPEGGCFVLWGARFPRTVYVFPVMGL